MSAHQPKRETPGPAGRTALGTLRFWTAPIIISLAVLSALATLYLAGTLNPITNLRHFPIAIVNQDTGPAGKLITDKLVSNLDKNQFDIRVLSADEARDQLDTAKVYGQVVIPHHLTRQLASLPHDAVLPGHHPARPVITIWTNPRASAMGAGIVGQTMNQALAVVDIKTGQMLTAQLQPQTGGAALPGGAALVLANPIDIQSAVYDPLPRGTGNGLSAFYFSLLLLIAGVTSAIVVSITVDALLGYTPAEFGPMYRLADRVKVSRLRTLLAEWVLVVLLGLSTSAVFLGIAVAMGMPVPQPWQLWLFGAFIITAVGIASTSLIAALGSLGTLISLLVFLFLGLPSTGATVPLEATPRFYGWFAGFEPMRQAFLGSRALVYFDGRMDAGLSRSLTVGVIGLVAGLVFGAVVTWIYDRKGFHGIASPTETETETAAGTPEQAVETVSGDTAS